MGQPGKFDEVERAGADIKRRETQQHEHAAADGVDDELVRCPGRAGAAPEFQQKKGWNKAEFPKQEPMEKIQREEYAERGTLQGEEERTEQAWITRDAP